MSNDGCKMFKNMNMFSINIAKSKYFMTEYSTLGQFFANYLAL